MSIMKTMPEAEVVSSEAHQSGTAVAVTQVPGSLAARIVFRFAFTYLALYCLPWSGRVSLLDVLGGWGDILQSILEWPWRALCPWVAVHVFRLSGPVTRYHETGSGDTTLDYIQVFCFLVIAAVVALLWSLLDHRRKQYRTLYAWLRLLVRFTPSVYAAYIRIRQGFSDTVSCSRFQ